MSPFTLRPAVATDAEIIFQYIVELAEYEKARNEVTATVDDIQRTLFADPQQTVSAIICEQQGEPVGFAVYFYNYSTWQGKKGIYLEDLYVTPAARGKGAGKMMLQHLAQKAVSEGCGRFEWSVLDWNQPAIDVYQAIGARAKDSWLGYQLAEDALERFANLTD